MYCHSSSRQKAGSIINSSCNGGIARSNICILDANMDGWVYILGVGQNMLENLPIGLAAGYVATHDGAVIVIMPNYVLLPKGDAIHLPAQLCDLEC
jgi:hypothetical protein